MRFGELTYREIALEAGRDTLILFPTGCTEQQGAHLPVDFDTWLAEEVSLASAERVWIEHGIQSLVMPAIPYGPTPEHRGFGAGYVDLPQTIHEDVIFAVVDSLISQGFRRILIWRGCGQHSLETVVDRVIRGAPEGIEVEIAPDIYAEIWKSHGIARVECGHADAFGTSIALYRRPGAVRRDQIQEPSFSVPDWDDPDLDLSKHSDTGSIGDPSSATRELGAELWEATIERTADIILDFHNRTAENTPPQ